jgi:hypothetical protein
LIIRDNRSGLSKKEFEPVGKKVDVAINVYGKPYETLVTLKTLMSHSGQHIDKIYFIQEREQPPWSGDFDLIFKRFDNIEVFIPKHFLYIYFTDRDRYGDEDYRLSIRYQYAWEHTDKDYLFITHNDMLYTDDIIGKMLNSLKNGKTVGVGQIGRCSYCPAFHASKCKGNKYLKYDPTYEEVMDLIKKHPHAKPELHDPLIDKKHPMPLPECRLNEWACLIRLKEIRREGVPQGTIDPFGAYVGTDVGTKWFRELVLKGYKFKDIDIHRYGTHGWGKFPGHETSCNSAYYTKAEDAAIEYLEDVLGEDLDT